MMQKLLELRHRMRTVRNIKAVTSTMTTVAAAKLSRTRWKAEALGAYAGKLRGILYDQQVYLTGFGRSLAEVSPLLRARPGGRTRLALVITGDRGMCGGYNLAIQRFALDFWERSVMSGRSVAFVTKGKKGEVYLRRRGAQIVHSETWPREGVVVDDVRRLLKLLTEAYLSGECDEAYVFYTRFYSPIRHKPVLLRLLPFELGVRERFTRPRESANTALLERWSYEPSFPEVIRELLAVALLVQLHDVLLESYASEQGARMITMKEAAERAERTLRECQVAYNRLRREAITIDLLSSLFAAKVAEEEPTMPSAVALGIEEGDEGGAA